MKASEVLIGAAEAIQEHGWCQGEVWNDAGCLCAYGAMVRAARGFNQSLNRAVEVLSNATGNVSHGKFIPVAAWNDLPYMTKEVVVSTLLKTAVEAAKAGK